MLKKNEIRLFLESYDEKLIHNVWLIRDLLNKSLPGIIEQIDGPANMLAYTYGPKYADVIAVLIPSKKGLKLSFNRGVQLTDNNKLLAGSGKITRYVHLNNTDGVNAPAITGFINEALMLYKNIQQAKK